MTVLSLLPSNQVSGFDVDFQHFDKLGHFLFYFLMSFLLLQYLKIAKKFESRSSTQFLFTIVICILYGTVLEVLQEMMNWGRHFEWNDILFNSLGTSVGAIVHGIFGKKI